MNPLSAWAEKRRSHEKYFAAPRRRAKSSAAHLSCVLDNTGRIKRKDLLSVVVVSDDLPRLPFFLDYYRRIGVAHFLFVDNGSSDGFLDYISQFDDCSVWSADTPAESANGGIDWVNHLLSRYGDGHWCLTLEPSEYLAFPYCESRNLHELIEFLDMEYRDHLFALVLDMYAPGRIGELTCAPGQNPLEVAPFFDAMGYSLRENHEYGDTFVQGGVRRRAFFRRNPELSPALNRIPLIKWSRDYVYLSRRLLAPKRLNRPHSPSHVSPTGCLLSFKLVPMQKADAVGKVDSDKALIGTAEAIRKGLIRPVDAGILVNEHSMRFEGSRQLHDLGLMNFGQWF